MGAGPAADKTRTVEVRGEALDRDQDVRLRPAKNVGRREHVRRRGGGGHAEHARDHRPELAEAHRGRRRAGCRVMQVLLGIQEHH